MATIEMPSSARMRVTSARTPGAAGSISEAARGAGVSYKAAWQAIETLGNLAGQPLQEAGVILARRRGPAGLGHRRQPRPGVVFDPGETAGVAGPHVRLQAQDVLTAGLLPFGPHGVAIRVPVVPVPVHGAVALGCALLVGTENHIGSITEGIGVDV